MARKGSCLLIHYSCSFSWIVTFSLQWNSNINIPKSIFIFFLFLRSCLFKRNQERQKFYMSCRNLIRALISTPFLPFLQNVCLLAKKPKGLSCLCLHSDDCLHTAGQVRMPELSVRKLKLFLLEDAALFLRLILILYL